MRRRRRLAWLRERDDGAALPVVLMATAGHASSLARDIQPPVVEFLHKPFGLTTLLESVRAAVPRTQRADPFSLYRTSSGSELFIG